MLKRYADEVSRLAGRYIHVMPELSVFKQRLLLTAYYKPVAENSYIQGVLAERERAAREPLKGRIVGKEIETVSVQDPEVSMADRWIGETEAFAKGARYFVEVDDPEIGEDEFYADTQEEITQNMRELGFDYKLWSDSEHKSMGKWDTVTDSKRGLSYKEKHFNKGGKEYTVRVYASTKTSNWDPAPEMFDEAHAKAFAIREAKRAIESGSIEGELLRGMQKLLDAGNRAYGERKKGS